MDLLDEVMFDGQKDDAHEPLIDECEDHRPSSDRVRHQGCRPEVEEKVSRHWARPVHDPAGASVECPEVDVPGHVRIEDLEEPRKVAARARPDEMLGNEPMLDGIDVHSGLTLRLELQASSSSKLAAGRHRTTD